MNPVLWWSWTLEKLYTVLDDGNPSQIHFVLIKHEYFGWPTKEGFENCKSCFVNGTIRVNFFLKKKWRK